MGMRDDAYVLPAVSGARILLGKMPDLCVCEFVAILRLPQYQISRHLGQLKRIDLAERAVGA